MKLTTILKVIKPVTSLVAASATGLVVKNVITATTPADLGKYQTFMVKAGGFFVGGAVGGLVADHVENSFDKVIQALGRPAESEDTPETVDWVTILQKLSPEDRKELERLIEHGVGKED